MKVILKKGIFHFFIILVFLCCFSCKQINQNISSYCKYWTGTVQYAKVEVISPHIDKNDGVIWVENLENLKFDMLVINPQEYELFNGMAKEDYSIQAISDFISIKDTNENSLQNVRLVKVKQKDSGTVSVEISLSEENEGKEFVFSGNLRPKDMEHIWEDSNFSIKFKQMTPPDSITNLSNEKMLLIDNYHCVSFKKPDNSIKRNQNVSYKISCIDTNGNVIVENRIVKDSDNKIGSFKFSDADFIYYFPEQTQNLKYNYKVSVIGSNGLESQWYSTDESLGRNQMITPEIHYLDNAYEIEEGRGGIYKVDDDYKVITYSKDEGGVSFEIQTDYQISDYTINNERETRKRVKLTQEGKYNIKFTVRKEGCPPITVDEKIYIVMEPQRPDIIFLNDAENFNIFDGHHKKLVKVKDLSDISFKYTLKGQNEKVSHLLIYKESSMSRGEIKQESNQFKVNEHVDGITDSNNIVVKIFLEKKGIQTKKEFEYNYFISKSIAMPYEVNCESLIPTNDVKIKIDDSGKLCEYYVYKTDPENRDLKIIIDFVNMSKYEHFYIGPNISCDRDMFTQIIQFWPERLKLEYGYNDIKCEYSVDGYVFYDKTYIYVDPPDPEIDFGGTLISSVNGIDYYKYSSADNQKMPYEVIKVFTSGTYKMTIDGEVAPLSADGTNGLTCGMHTIEIELLENHTAMESWDSKKIIKTIVVTDE